MKSPSKISVLLPIYNATSSLAEALESLLAQRFEDFEILALDDGSTDNSLDRLRAYAHHDKRIRLMALPHQGLVKTLNVGLAAAEAPVIARMDADDYAYPDRLEMQYQLLSERPQLGLASCLVEFGGDSEAQAGYAAYVRWINQLVEPEAISLNRFVDAPLAHPSVMFRKEWVKKAGGYRQCQGPEDYELWLRWLEAGIQMAKVPKVLLRWNDPSNRLSRVHPDYSREAFTKVRTPFLLRWLKSYNSHKRLAIWGAGRKTRQLARTLFDQGLKPDFFIDLKASRPIGGIPVKSYRSLDKDRDSLFILSLVNNRGARKEIRKFLLELGMLEGKDFLIS